MTIHIIADDADQGRRIALLLKPMVETNAFTLDSFDLRYGHLKLVVVHVNLHSTDNIKKLRGIESTLKRATKRIFILNSVSHLLAAQAYSLGATKVLFQPSARDILLELSDGSNLPQALSGYTSKVASAGASAIKDLFASVIAGARLDLVAIAQTEGMISDAIAEDGLANWLNVVRNHHDGTYQHCLLVTGVTVDFGLHLGLNRLDIGRLASAAMMHDIGKAAIPLSILDKPGKLDECERAMIETHPAIGFEALKNVDGITTEILDSVRHHHEFLDGSGYPDRLCGSSISDIVRILTISDIFAALIEHRSYRPCMSRDIAYEVLCSMRGKLDSALISAFKDVALRR